jgi:ABC-type spermidine/putrescine transport system permease subunit I
VAIERSAGLPRLFWPVFAVPAIVWLALLFVLPFYVIISIAFGRLDPLFLTPIPEYNPIRWDVGAFGATMSELFASGSVYRAAMGRTVLYVLVATALCLVIGYPVAYFVARHAGRWRTVFIALIVAPFWISYMMRMLAWVNVLRPSGYVNDALLTFGLIDQPIQWLAGRPITVILGLTYGYVPFMILPLFAGLDRIPRSTMEAARDLGGGQPTTFLRVTLPLSRQAILAGVILVMLPMFGDYFTQVLLASTRDTSMIGNLIVSSVQSSLVQSGASLVLILMTLLILPILYYLRASRGRSST